MKNRAIFLDRDGVINKNRPDNVKSWNEFEFEAGVLDALARLRPTDFRIVVVSNQSGIGRGHMSRAMVDEINARMIESIARAGGRIDAVYLCPHTPEDHCRCRKPSPEMLWRGRDEFALDLSQSYFVGDWLDDLRAGRRAGVTPLLVRTGRGEAALHEIGRQELKLDQVFENLADAVNWILAREIVAA